MSSMYQVIHGVVDIHHYTHKVFCNGHIPFANVLIKCRCFSERAHLYMNTMLSVAWVNLHTMKFIFIIIGILTKLRPLDTSQYPMSWLNVEAPLNISLFHMKIRRQNYENKHAISNVNKSFVKKCDFYIWSRLFNSLTKLVTLDTSQLPISGLQLFFL